VEWLSRLDALVVATGAGMLVDSGLAQYTGSTVHNTAETWSALKFQNLDFDYIRSPAAFNEDPELAWGFWLYCRSISREHAPHDGYQSIVKISQGIPLGSFVLDATHEGHWVAAGWPEDSLMEVRGSVRHLQCAKPCCSKVWPMPADLGLTEDPATGRAIGELPRCSSCGGVARPNVCSFEDEVGFCKDVWQSQQEKYHNFLGAFEYFRAGDRGLNIGYLELGCGRSLDLSRELQKNLGPNCKIIRVDLALPPAAAQAHQSQAVCVRLGARSALQRMERLLREMEWANFLVVDDNGMGAEITARVDAPVGHLLCRAGCELHWDLDASGTPNLEARHIYHNLTKKVTRSDRFPTEFFFERINEQGKELPVALLRTWGWDLRKRNQQFQDRAFRVKSLFEHMNGLFESAGYQQKLQEAPDRMTVQKMIREVHLQILPQHGFPTAGVKPSKIQDLIFQMRYFLGSGCFSLEEQVLADKSQTLSGQEKLASLPLRVKPSNPQQNKQVQRSTC